MTWRAAVACALLAAGCQPTATVPTAPPVPWTQAPDLDLDLRAWQSAPEVALLAPLRVVVDLYCGPGVECDFVPSVPADCKGRVTAHDFAALGAGRTRRFELDLRPTKLGELVISEFRAESKRAGSDAKPAVATTPALTVNVTSVLGEHGEAVEAPAPPFAPHVDLLPWMLGTAGVALLGLLVWWWRRRPRRLRQAADETPLPPHVLALRALARLRSAPRATPDEVDAFYVEVSRILRDYLERRFGVHAPERTTEEFLAELNAQGSQGPLDPAQRNALAGFLRQCDLVKFARLQPAEDVHAETLRFAEELVEATRADRMPRGIAS
ncbi:MAG: hypothetical protein R3F56_00090 [Planctomycetota bacterium]